jgi:transcription elongation factor GreB
VSKAFTKESDGDDDEELESQAPLPQGLKNYMTRVGYQSMREELDVLVKTERPKVVETVSWAASNGDRSENGDYIYGKKRLREIDRRIRFLIKRLEIAEVVDPSEREETDQVFFGATVTFEMLDADLVQPEIKTFQIVGVDEANASEGRISWISPIGRALLKARVGDSVRFPSPTGERELEILEVVYR